ncbi:hypothetical protein [Streptomyces seoulensis]|uniref:hypothetical protein n=1 Tax=Streptomyces seoulensis TaxID=73044 RepID=UPI00103FD26D|nr:hypothetical protein [Streptomyces seoulensis]
MSKKRIGSELDALGLEVEVPDGMSVVRASVETWVGAADGSSGFEVSSTRVSHKMLEEDWHVPHPVVNCSMRVTQKGVPLTAEQRDRVAKWLRANGVDPRLVERGDIRLEWRDRGGHIGNQIICFTQFYVDEAGNRAFDERTCEAVRFERAVPQIVELEPDPAWEGWDSYLAHRSGESE